MNDANIVSTNTINFKLPCSLVNTSNVMQVFFVYSLTIVLLPSLNTRIHVISPSTCISFGWIVLVIGINLFAI